MPAPFQQRLQVTIGILALQGAFAEHQNMLQKVTRIETKVIVVLVRLPDDLARCDALIIPGGESTAIASLARSSGLLEPLREFIQKKPVWGTCAGAILLAQAVENTKKGGQELLGGMSITVARNGWGPQIESFEAPLVVNGISDPEKPFTGIFIRAPVILNLNHPPNLPPIEVIARLPAGVLPRGQQLIAPDESNDDLRDMYTSVAIRQGKHLLTTFHPELTKDIRFHEYFVQKCVLQSLT